MTRQEYHIVSEVDYNDFINAVNSALIDGWTLQGGVSASVSMQINSYRELIGDYTRYTQAVVKEITDEPIPDFVP